jgi:hypothetical protein
MGMAESLEEGPSQAMLDDVARSNPFRPMKVRIRVPFRIGLMIGTVPNAKVMADCQFIGVLFGAAIEANGFTHHQGTRIHYLM